MSAFNYNQPSQNSQQPEQIRHKTNGQVKYYYDLCKQRRINPINIANHSYEQMDALIKSTLSFHPATDKQIETIKEKIANLQNYGVEVSQLSDEKLAKLTGGTKGTASLLIATLIQKEREISDKLPPTEKQVEYLVPMYLCPDVPFEDYDISRRVELEEVVIQPNGDIKKLWRRPTTEEFAEQIKEKLTTQSANRLIDQARGPFHEWKRSRISQGQIDYVRELEKRLSNIETPKIIEWSIVDGELQQIVKKVEDKSINYNPQAYQPLDDLTLLQYSYDDASKFIDQLKSELEKKELYRYGEVNDASQTFESLRSAQNEHDAAADEFVQLNNFVYALQSKAGFTDDELLVSPYQDSLTKATSSDPFFFDENKQNKIVEYMEHALIEDLITYNAMRIMCSNCLTTKELFVKVTSRLTKNPETAMRILVGDQETLYEKQHA